LSWFVEKKNRSEVLVMACYDPMGSSFRCTEFVKEHDGSQLRIWDRSENHFPFPILEGSLQGFAPQ
jgi:hypothetical protein